MCQCWTEIDSASNDFIPLYCPYCKYEYCTGCENQECDLCTDHLSEQSKCPQCSSTLLELEIHICIECMFYSIYSGEIVFCMDCNEICPSKLLDDISHDDHIVLRDISLILSIVARKYPNIMNSGKIQFENSISESLILS
jgi:hypothetical protein